MTTNTITALRALAQHLERYELDGDSVMRACVVDSDRIDVQIYAGPDVDMSALLARWADTIDGAAVTAEPVQDSYHVYVRGAISGCRIAVVCVASGARADQIRAALGIPAPRPALPTGDALLDALTMRQAAA